MLRFWTLQDLGVNVGAPRAEALDCVQPVVQVCLDHARPTVAQLDAGFDERRIREVPAPCQVVTAVARANGAQSKEPALSLREAELGSGLGNELWRRSGDAELFRGGKSLQAEREGGDFWPIVTTAATASDEQSHGSGSNVRSMCVHAGSFGGPTPR